MLFCRIIPYSTHNRVLVHVIKRSLIMYMSGTNPSSYPSVQPHRCDDSVGPFAKTDVFDGRVEVCDGEPSLPS